MRTLALAGRRRRTHGTGAPAARGVTASLPLLGPLVAVAASLAAGCTLFGASLDPVATYRLQGSGAPAQPFAGEASRLLEIATPLPAPGFATARMIYERKDFRNEAFAYAEWVDTLPAMVRDALIEYFAELDRFESVVAAPSPQRADYRLESRALFVIQHFDGQRSEVEVSLRARLVAVEDRRLLGVQRFSVTLPAPTADPEGGVRAANEALDALFGELAQFVLAHVAG